MTDSAEDPAPQQIPNDNDPGEEAPDLPDEYEGDEDEIQEPGI
jgi:hypothetical protein